MYKIYDLHNRRPTRDLFCAQLQLYLDRLPKPADYAVFISTYSQSNARWPYQRPRPAFHREPPLSTPSKRTMRTCPRLGCSPDSTPLKRLTRPMQTRPRLGCGRGSTPSTRLTRQGQTRRTLSFPTDSIPSTWLASPRQKRRTLWFPRGSTSTTWLTRPRQTRPVLASCWVPTALTRSKRPMQICPRLGCSRASTPSRLPTRLTQTSIENFT